MKYYFPIHLDGGNRGCEGIAKGTAAILGEPKESLIGLCKDIPLDNRLGTGDEVSLQPYRKVSFWFRIINKVYVSAMNVLRKDNFEKGGLYRLYTYLPFINQMQTDDIMLSTGGDMMCYNDNFVISTVEWAKKRGAKTILWGCSMGKENLTPRKEMSLRLFDLVYARESLSYEFFKSLGLKNVVCYPDPAFILQPEKVDLPTCFTRGHVIGINLTDYTVGAFDLNTSFGREVRMLLDYIFTSTTYQVLLIPHVMWNGQDDRIIALSVLDEYQLFSDKITILNSEDLNYLQIRYVVSQCYAFIGGRTHAVISAYSTCVPTIALGYSIKSRGIAKDLNISDKYVVDSKHITKEGVLLNAFIDLETHSADIRNHLCTAIPEYVNRIKDVKSMIESI